jgi:hypothetical protein
LSNKDIARRLYITEGTGKAHPSAAFSKPGVRNRTQAALVVQELRIGYANADRRRWYNVCQGTAGRTQASFSAGDCVACPPR